MGGCALELAHVFRRWGPGYRAAHEGRLSREQLRAMRAIETCRTAALGGHLYRCDACRREKVLPNSCRNRHCPKCQRLDQHRWLEARKAELLPTAYFHVVFTLPHELNPITVANPALVYELLFRSASEALLQAAANPKLLGAKIGILAVLHTWAQTLTLHPHLHCIVPGGGLATGGEPRWIASRPEFLLPVQVLARLFRGKFLAGLRQAYRDGEITLGTSGCHLADPRRFATLVDSLYRKGWVVYSKPPFAGPETVLSYLARYTHRIAISDSRLLRLEGERVVFSYKDYSRGGRNREMTLEAHELIRRFLLHVLPPRFVRVRYYGLLAHRDRNDRLAHCRALLCGADPPPPRQETWDETLLRLTGADPLRCPHCKQGRLVLLGFLARPPPIQPRKLAS